MYRCHVLRAAVPVAALAACVRAARRGARGPRGASRRRVGNPLAVFRFAVPRVGQVPAPLGALCSASGRSVFAFSRRAARRARERFVTEQATYQLFGGTPRELQANRRRARAQGHARAELSRRRCGAALYSETTLLTESAKRYSVDDRSGFRAARPVTTRFPAALPVRVALLEA